MDDQYQIADQQQAPPQDDPKKKLWQKLNASGSYTKSYDEFVNQFNNPQSINKLYTALNSSGKYTKSQQDFTNQFFSQNASSSTSAGIRENKKINIEDARNFIGGGQNQRDVQFQKTFNQPKKQVVTSKPLTEDEITSEATKRLQENTPLLFNGDDPIGNINSAIENSKNQLREGTITSQADITQNENEGKIHDKMLEIANQNPFGTTQSASNFLYNQLKKVTGKDVPINSVNISDIENTLPKNASTQAAIQKVANNRFITATMNESKDFGDFINKYENASNKFLNIDKSDERQQANAYQQILNDPDVQEAAKGNKQMWDGYLQERHNFNNKFPDLAKQQIASKISQYAEDSGMNNAIFNNRSQKGWNDIVDKMYKEGKIDASDKAFYNQNITPSDLKTTGLVESFGRGYEEGIRQIGQTIGLQDMGLLKDMSKDTQVNPTKNVILGGGGKLMGNIVPMLLTGGALKGAGFGEKASNGFAAMLQFGGGNAEQAKKYFPNNPVGQFAYTALGTTIDTLLMDLPMRAQSGLKQFLNGEVKSLATKLSDNTISDAVKEQMKQSFVNKVIGASKRYGVDLLKHNAQTAGVLTGIDLLHKGLNLASGDKSAFEGTDVPKELAQNFLMASPLSAISALGALKGQKSELNTAINDLPEGVYTSPIKEALKNGDTPKLETYLKDVAEQLSNPQSETFTRKVFGDKLSDIATKLYPNVKSEPINIEQPNTTTPTTNETGAEVRDTENELNPTEPIENGLPNSIGRSGEDVGDKEKLNEAIQFEREYNNDPKNNEYEWQQKYHKEQLNLLDNDPIRYFENKRDAKDTKGNFILDEERRKEIDGFVNLLKAQTNTNSGIKEGFTDGAALNEIYRKAKEKYGDKKGAQYYEAANRLVNPNENTIIEVRSNGVVVYENGKYLLKPFGNTDANYKKWTLYNPLDISDQYIKNEVPITPKEESTPIKEANTDKQGASESEKPIEQQPIPIQNEGQPPSETPPVVAGESEGNKVGVHHAALTDLAKRLNLQEPERGSYWTPELYADRGRRLLNEGANPNEIDNVNNSLHDRISIGRAHLEDLVRSADAIGREKGVDSEEYKKAWTELNDYAKKVKGLGTEAHRAMASLQGERDLDTGSFSVVKKEVENITGRPTTAEQDRKIKSLTEQNEALRKRAEEAEAKLVIETDKVLNETDKPEKTTATKKAKDIANRLRKAKIHKPDSFSAATPASIVWDGAVEVVAKSIEAGGELADAIQKGVVYIKKSDWYKSLTDEKKKQAEEDFTKWHKQKATPLDSTIESLWNRFEGKEDKEFTPEESRAIWNYAKEKYIKNGVPYKDMIDNLSEDLGLSWRQVVAAITPKYNKHLVSVSDAMWKQKSDLRRHQTATNNWIENQSRNYALRTFRKVSGIFRGTAVFGHGAIFVGTHSGMTLFDIPKVKHTLKAFLNGYKFAYGKTGKYEQSMEELKHRENYLLAQRAGLKNNPDNIDAEEYQRSQKYLGKLAGAGERGFNAIKVLRQDLFDWEYSKLKAPEKADPKSSEAIAWLINNATGATNLKIPDLINEVSFAGGMEAARWGKLTRNPLRATSIALKSLVSKNVPIDEKVFAKVWARRVGTQLGTMAGMLALNAAFQQLINPKNPVNLTNPNKPDFGKFKFGDIAIDPTSGMRGAANFIYGLGKIPFESRKQLRGDSPMQSAGKQTAGYMRGKLSPFYSTLADFYNKTDFKGNPMPFSSEKPTAGHHKLSWGEYLWQKAPLPVAEAATEMYNQALNNGQSKVGVNHAIDGIISGGLSGATGFRVGEYDAEEHDRSAFTEEDKKDPTFKYFLDKGLELPNTVHSSEEITDENNLTKKKLSDYPQKVQDNYDKIHKNYLKERLRDIISNGEVYVKKYKNSDGTFSLDVSLKDSDNREAKPISKLSVEELAQVLRLAQSDATKKTKDELFNNQ